MKAPIMRRRLGRARYLCKELLVVIYSFRQITYMCDRPYLKVPYILVLLQADVVIPVTTFTHS